MKKMKIARRRLCLPILCAVATAIFVAGCPPPPTPTGPTGADLYTLITQSDPFETWAQFPEATGTIESAPPHGPLANVFINSTVVEAMANFSGALPDGSIIVKESFDEAGTESGDSITVMWKQTGFDPANNDWFWGRFAFDGEILAEGQVAGCFGCHGIARANDFVFLHQF